MTSCSNRTGKPSKMADHEGDVQTSASIQEPETSESAPLLQDIDTNGSVNEPPPPFPTSPSSNPASPPPAYSEMPPPYTPSPGVNTEPSVVCRVCQQLIYIRGREHQRVVKCGNCQEATPIRAPPTGKKYIRCPCNALLTCKVSSTRISCPRPNCKRIIDLSPTPSVPSVAAAPMPSRARFRVTCGHCNEIFVFHTTNHLAKCPHCRRISSVGPRFAKTRATIFAIVGFIFLAAGIGVTVGTLSIAQSSGGIYVVWVGAFIAGLLNLIRSCYYCTMTVSSIEGEP